MTKHFDSLLVIVAASSTAAADEPTVIDLDKDREGAWRLAEAAGACDKGQPAFVATWCNRTTPVNARFAMRIEVTARDATAEILSVTVPVTSQGKGLISAFVPPPIYCDAQTCLYPETMAIFVRTKMRVAAADVRALAVTFDVNGSWRIRQWWGPKASHVDIKLLDAAGKPIGEGVMLTPTQ